MDNVVKYLIVALGNPGANYCRTRHNIGFQLADSILNQAGPGSQNWKKDYSGKAESASLLYIQADATMHITLLKPLTYMNLSGTAVVKALKHLQLAPAQMLVLHDETELPFGEFRFKFSGGHKGHNGLRSIMQHIGKDFHRLRFGVGRPQDKIKLADYLLSSFSSPERLLLPELFTQLSTEILDIYLMRHMSLST